MDLWLGLSAADNSDYMIQWLIMMVLLTVDWGTGHNTWGPFNTLHFGCAFNQQFCYLTTGVSWWIALPWNAKKMYGQKSANIIPGLFGKKRRDSKLSNIVLPNSQSCKSVHLFLTQAYKLDILKKNSRAKKTQNSRKKLNNSKKPQGFGNICRIERRNKTFFLKNVIFNAYFLPDTTKTVCENQAFHA